MGKYMKETMEKIYERKHMKIYKRKYMKENM
jgi:hypothetical protein